MIWRDEEDDTRPLTSSQVADVVFVVQGKTLPYVYEEAVFHALRTPLPWIQDHTDIGIRVYFSAEEGNGWYRDDNPNGVIYLSRRTRLVLRVPTALVEQTATLCGYTLMIAEHALQIGDMKLRPLNANDTLYARNIVSTSEDEAVFEQMIVTAVAALGVQCRKLVCGKQRQIKTDQGALTTRSIMLADLKPNESIALQEQGIGTHRALGCGIFIPHKGIT
ncbi:MAG: type I-MYXAN CRISPR-associated protein Cas6/Cmx6 [Pseudomonadota bacterium]